jgi:hypothetical protein
MHFAVFFPLPAVLIAVHPGGRCVAVAHAAFPFFHMMLDTRNLFLSPPPFTIFRLE